MKLKKIGALLLTAVLGVSMLAGCGGGSSSAPAASEASGSSEGGSAEAAPAATGDMKTVKLVFPGLYSRDDAPMVQDAINEYLGATYGIQTEITYIDMGSWTQQTNLLLTGDGVDVLCYWTMPLATYVSNKQVLPLDDYMAKADPKLKELFTEEQWEACQIDGVQYTIPNLRNYGSDMALNVKEGVLAEMGMTTDDIKSLEDVDAFLYAAREKYPDIPYIITPQSNSQMVNGWSWDGLGDQNHIADLGNCGQDTTVYDIFELPDFQEFCKWTHKWYEDGLIMGDALSNQDTGLTHIQNGNSLCYLTNQGPDKPLGVETCVIIPNWSDSTNVSVLTYGINRLSKVPDEAFTLLQALYIDETLQNLIFNGIEGVHYVMNEDGSCSFPDGKTNGETTYAICMQSWAMPYAGNIPANLELSGSPTFFDDVRAFNAATKVSKAVGFTYDQSQVTDQYTACLNVKDKYYDGLMCGVLDPETAIPAAIQEMKDAGIDDIVAAKQAALDELLGQ